MRLYDLQVISLGLLLTACSGGKEVPGAEGKLDSTATPVSTSSTPSAAVDWRVTVSGAGPVVFGASVADTRRAMGADFNAPAADACGSVRVPGSPAGMRFMVEAGRVVRVDVDSAGPTTDRGAAVGMSESDLQHGYGDSLEVMPHKYDPQGHYLIYHPHAPADSSHRVVFETDGRAVTRYRAGIEPAVEYVESCG